MAVDLTRNNVALERMNDFEGRLSKAEEGINSIFASYNIPDNVTDYNRMLSYALAEIGDDKAKREELKKNFTEAEKSLGEKTEYILEDFTNMVKEGRENLDRIAEQIRKEEEILQKDEAERTSKEERLKEIDEEIKRLNDEKAVIGGPNGKGGQIADEKAKSVAIKKEQEAITKEIQRIEAEILKISQEKDRVTELMKTATTKDELDKYAAQINELDGKRTSLENEKNGLTVQFQEKEDKKRGIEENIRKLNLEYSNKDSEISTKLSEKTTIENYLRILPGRKPELDKLKQSYEDMKKQFDLTAEKTMKNLEEKGLDVKLDEKIENKAEEKAQDKVEKPKEEKAEPKVKAEKQVQGPVNYVQDEGQAFEENTLPIVTPEERKRQNFEYITGYSSDGIGLSSDDRLNRLKSNLGGRDYEAMTKALNEPAQSPVKLTRSEKKELKKMMKEDRQTLSKTLSGLDQNKLTNLFEMVGVELDSKEMNSLKLNSFKLDDGPSLQYGILDGFSSMNENQKTIWRDVVSNYGKVKGDLSDEQKDEFEKCILTPIKFGTLKKDVDKACEGRVSRFFSKFGGVDTKVKDIKAAVAEVELSAGEDIKSRSQAKSFTDSLRSKTEKYPPEPETRNQDGQNQDRDER